AAIQQAGVKVLVRLDASQRLVLAGLPEARDHVLKQLDSTEDGGTTSGTYKGKEVRQKLTAGDTMARDLAGWRTDKWEYEALAPEETRAKQRAELKHWLREQFARIEKGMPPAMTTRVQPLHFPQWHLDAP